MPRKHLTNTKSETFGENLIIHYPFALQKLTIEIQFLDERGKIA